MVAIVSHYLPHPRCALCSVTLVLAAPLTPRCPSRPQVSGCDVGPAEAGLRAGAGRVRGGAAPSRAPPSAATARRGGYQHELGGEHAAGKGQVTG